MMNFDANSMNLSYAALAALAYNNIYILYDMRLSLPSKNHSTK